MAYRQTGLYHSSQGPIRFNIKFSLRVVALECSPAQAVAPPHNKPARPCRLGFGLPSGWTLSCTAGEMQSRSGRRSRRRSRRCFPELAILRSQWPPSRSWRTWRLRDCSSCGPRGRQRARPSSRPVARVRTGYRRACRSTHKGASMGPPRTLHPKNIQGPAVSQPPRKRLLDLSEQPFGCATR